MLRLRLQLRDGVYWSRWELLGTYSEWKQGTASRLETVMAANQRGWPHHSLQQGEPRLNLEQREGVFWYRWELQDTCGGWQKGSDDKVRTTLAANQAMLDSAPLGD